MRWPIIRHVRYLWHLWWVNEWYYEWQRMGYHDLNAEHDYAHLDRIWRGEA